MTPIGQSSLSPWEVNRAKNRFDFMKTCADMRTCIDLEACTDRISLSVVLLTLKLIETLSMVVLGIVLLSIGEWKNNQIKKNDGCNIVKSVCVFIPNKTTGYGYINPNAMNVTTPLESGCLVNDPAVNCSSVGGDIDCYANVTYRENNLGFTTRTELTITSFSNSTVYYRYLPGTNVKCYTDPYRPNLVSYYPYTYPSPQISYSLVISGIVLVCIGGSIFYVICFVVCMTVITYRDT